MTQTRFKLPPRAKATPDIDRRVAAEAKTAGLMFPFMPDVRTLLTVRRRNIQALIAANEAVMNGVLTIARRNLEIFARTLTGPTEGMEPTAESATANFKELSEIIRHANTEAAEILTRRFVAAMAEVMPPGLRMQQ